MDNAQIADCFSLLAKLADIHGENSFKTKAYSSAAFAIEKLPVQLSEMPRSGIASVKGIGDSSGKKVIELLETGELQALNNLIANTPEGIMEMLSIKGIGPKKIATIWKEMEIETVGELLYACKENRLKLYKGFGEKTQQNVIETIEYYLKGKGSFLYAQVESIAGHFDFFFKEIFSPKKINISGAVKRHLEIVEELTIVVDDNADIIQQKMSAADDFEMLEKNEGSILYNSASGLKVRLLSCEEKPFAEQVFFTNCSDEFGQEFKQKFGAINYAACADDESVFAAASLPFIPASLRENPAVIDMALEGPLPSTIEAGDIKGIIHSHSDWSDGSNTLEQMAQAAIAKGLEYLVISDHSKTAFYANGLNEERVKAQHQYIDELNSKLAPFKIFKSIESDILNDGSLDYSDAVLSTFDLVIASVHSNLKMTEEKAMMRLMNAIKNPYTTILGHMTGRLLLSRKGYPVNHEAIIDACAANNVAIELNANPSRLDIDWRHIEYALQKNVLISINPDAHSTAGFEHTKYGVLVAQKALLNKESNLSSFSLQEFEIFLSEKKKARNN